MKAIFMYDGAAWYGNMDPDSVMWIAAIIYLPEDSATLLAKSLRADYKLGVTLCKDFAKCEEVLAAADFC